MKTLRLALCGDDLQRAAAAVERAGLSVSLPSQFPYPRLHQSQKPCRNNAVSRCGIS